MFGFSMILMSTWETVLGSVYCHVLLMSTGMINVEQCFYHRPPKWRYCRPNLGLYFCMGWFPLCEHLHG